MSGAQFSIRRANRPPGDAKLGGKVEPGRQTRPRREHAALDGGRHTFANRTTRSLSLTESGRQSLERAKRILADGAAVEAEILEEAAIPRGLIRLASTTAFGMHQLAPLLPKFVSSYPEVAHALLAFIPERPS